MSETCNDARLSEKTAKTILHLSPWSNVLGKFKFWPVITDNLKNAVSPSGARVFRQMLRMMMGARRDTDEDRIEYVKRATHTAEERRPRRWDSRCAASSIYIYIYLIYKGEPGPGALWADSFPHAASALFWNLGSPPFGPVADQKGLRS